MAKELEEIKKMFPLSTGELSGADIGGVDLQKAIFECKKSFLGKIIEEKLTKGKGVKTQMPEGGKAGKCQLPEGWTLVQERNRDGEIVKCYTNAIGQKFFTMEDLLGYVDYAKRQQLSIYKPGFDPSKIVDTDLEDKGSDSSEGEEKRNELEKASTIDPPKASKPKKHAGDTSRWNKSRSTTEIPRQIGLTGEKMDDAPTSSYKGEGITTSSLTRLVPLRASRRLTEHDPETAPYMDLGKVPELKTMDDLITSRNHGQMKDGNE
ncbi:hypothetical protein ACH5RR_021611 [Cinchona calisaya]|uniref:MBD domain-containing protein n=1 Tax=Cinchona calisaya TaxID=153742 RepID=A0ABD2ZKQ5_9GENT